MKLDSLKINEKAIITQVNMDVVPLKLIELGFIEGNFVELLHIAPFNDPIYVKVNDSHISIRKELAKEITIEII
ncbi:ferrous iron transport protein A [Paenimyroides tangerinum]|uniref:Ferrous iron transport protein A n=1 Tax=Paenimyroides tangerinum TaxID=2488728 RepID=A0A3P3WCY7_9FLAO|nr:FeoA family protein [Paenimyroides tangerinum]RRJ92258.1 ferrous iron transport protein A [Paenimyroides tangerinum]